MSGRRFQKPSIQLRESFFDRKPSDLSSPTAPNATEPPSRRSSSSEYDSPTSPIFSAVGHHRVSSSSTTLSMSPTIPDAPDMSPAGKDFAPGLPDVVEDPLERESSPLGLRTSNSSFGKQPLASHTSQIPPRTYTRRTDLGLANQAEWSATDYYFASLKRTELGDFQACDTPLESSGRYSESDEQRRSGFAERIARSFSSFTRRRIHKRSSLATDSDPGSGFASPTGPRSRSTSRARSLFRRSGAAVTEDEYVDTNAPNPNSIDTITEDAADEYFSSSELRHSTSKSSIEQFEEPVRVSTPLLPHLMGQTRLVESEGCALQEPTVASSSELSSTALSAPASHLQSHEKPSPTLSSQPSTSALQPSQNSTHTASSTGMHPTLASESDPWADALGHADFHIEPSPYVPTECTMEAYQQFLADFRHFDSASNNHIVHVDYHHGAESKIARLTAEKLAWIRKQWGQAYSECRSMALKQGNAGAESVVKEPLPAATVPVVDEKCAAIGEQGIVGLMEQVAPQPKVSGSLSRRSSARQSIMRRISKRHRAQSGSDDD